MEDRQRSLAPHVTADAVAWGSRSRRSFLCACTDLARAPAGLARSRRSGGGSHQRGRQRTSRVRLQWREHSGGSAHFACEAGATAPEHKTLATGRTTEATLGPTRCIRCIGTTSAAPASGSSAGAPAGPPADENGTPASRLVASRRDTALALNPGNGVGPLAVSRLLVNARAAAKRRIVHGVCAAVDGFRHVLRAPTAAPRTGRRRLQRSCGASRAGSGRSPTAAAAAPGPR